MQLVLLPLADSLAQENACREPCSAPGCAPKGDCSCSSGSVPLPCLSISILSCEHSSLGGPLTKSYSRSQLSNPPCCIPFSSSRWLSVAVPLSFFSLFTGSRQWKAKKRENIEMMDLSSSPGLYPVTLLLRTGALDSNPSSLRSYSLCTFRSVALSHKQ